MFGVNCGMNFNDYVNIIKERLSEKRFNHSLRVVNTAEKIGQGYGLDMDKLRLAALLHDYAKDMEHSQLLRIAEKNELVTCTAEKAQPDLLHGPVGAYLLREELDIKDEEILQAVHYHTTGNVNMSIMDIIVYLADLIEPCRTYKGVTTLRRMLNRQKDVPKVVAEHNLYKGMLFAFDSTIEYVIREQWLIHPLTVEARNWILFFMLEE